MARTIRYGDHGVNAADASYKIAAKVKPDR
jgi:hypothetical protein